MFRGEQYNQDQGIVLDDRKALDEFANRFSDYVHQVIHDNFKFKSYMIVDYNLGIFARGERAYLAEDELQATRVTDIEKLEGIVTDAEKDPDCRIYKYIDGELENPICIRSKN